MNERVRRTLAMPARVLGRLARNGWLWAILLSVPAMWPLLGATYFSSDDGIAHLFRVPGLDNALRQGVLYPRVFENFAYGYSYPLLGYYGPVGYYAAELFHLLGAGFPDALKLMFALGYCLSGLFAYRLAKCYVSTAPALLGAAAYIYFPYHLAETYQRGAYAEHLAWIFLPLALLPITPDSTDMHIGRVRAFRISNKRAVLAAGALALLILTHSLTAFIFLPVAALYFWIITPGSLRERLRYGGLIAFGTLGLSAFSWLPLITESRWLLISHALDKPAKLALAPLSQWLEFTPIFQHEQLAAGEAIHPLGLISALALLAAIGALFFRRRARTESKALAFFIVLALSTWGMTGDLTSGVWALFAFPLAYLQFAWRLMTLTGLGSALAMALTFQNSRKVALLLIPVVLVSGLADVKYKPLPEMNTDELSMWRFDLRDDHIGTTYFQEFLPLWVTNPALEIPQPLDKPRSAIVRESPHLTLLEGGYQFARYRVDTDVPATVVLHQFYMPQWQARLAGLRLPMYPSGPLGLASVDIPATHGETLDLDFGQTDLEQLGLASSLLALVVLALVARDTRLTGTLVALIGLYGLLIAAQQQPSQTITPVDARFENGLVLIAVSTPPGPWRNGTAINVSMQWQAFHETNENLKAFVHLVDAQTGRLVTQTDSAPGPVFSPTSRWVTGEIISDRRVLTIPTDAVAGHVQLYVGLYRGTPPVNLSAERDGQFVPGGRTLVGDFEIKTR